MVKCRWRSGLARVCGEVWRPPSPAGPDGLRGALLRYACGAGRLRRRQVGLEGYGLVIGEDNMREVIKQLFQELRIGMI